MACKDDSGYITQQNIKNQKGDMTCQHTDYIVMCCQITSPFWFLLFQLRHIANVILTNRF